MPIGEPDTDGPFVLDDDLGHLCVGHDLSARTLDHREDACGDSGRAPDRIGRAAEVVGDHHRVNEEAAVGGHQSVVSELPREHADELLVLRDLFEHLAGRPKRLFGDAPAHHPAE